MREDASRGAVHASFSYQRKQLDSYGWVNYQHQTLTVNSGANTLYSGPVCGDSQFNSSCGPAYAYEHKQSLSLRNVWGGKSPEAVLDLYSGGAHCCSVTDVVVDVNGRGVFAEHSFGDRGYVGQWHAGTYYFVSGDDRFAYAFTDYADSVLPVQVWTLNRNARFVNSTRSRLDLVQANATRVWADFVDRRGKHADVRGPLAAWCADEYLLGQASACSAELQLAVRTGLLSRFGVPAGEAYVNLVKSSLRNWGY
jgi:hypothetical protein